MSVPRGSIYIHRFWQKVDQSGGPKACWPWLGYRKPSGHGLTSLNSVPIHASRKAWILTHGPIRQTRRGEQMCVNHRCDNELCCNPAHMYLGTRSDNMIDRWSQSPGKTRTRLGRPHMLTDEQLERLWQMRQDGATLKECAEHFGVHIATICRYITTVRREKLVRLREKVT